MDHQQQRQPSPALAAALERDGGVGEVVLIAEAMEMTGLTRPGFYRAAAKGEFDLIPLSPRRSVVLKNQVVEWIRSKVEGALKGVAPEGRDAAVAAARAAARASVEARRARKARKVRGSASARRPVKGERAQ